MLISELIERLGELTNPFSLNPTWLFRGQSNASWSLEPSLTRIFNKRKLNRGQALQAEKEGLNLFITAARAFLPLELTTTLLPKNNTVDYVGWFNLMQHFSAPTRSLDWSLSPWVAHTLHAVRMKIKMARFGLLILKKLPTKPNKYWMVKIFLAQ